MDVKITFHIKILPNLAQFVNGMQQYKQLLDKLLFDDDVATRKLYIRAEKAKENPILHGGFEQKSNVSQKTCANCT